MEQKQYRSSIKLIKGKDHYRWEVFIYGEDTSDIIQELEKVDSELNHKWGRVEDNPDS